MVFGSLLNKSNPMKPIFLLLILTLIISCAKDSPKSKLKSILREYQPAEQIFEIESGGSIAIVGEKGTKIELNTEDLVFENGEKAEFPIEISLLELTTKENLMKANAQTVSNGRWLVSGGAYRIKAFSRGKELQLKEGSSYDVTFPKITDGKMSLFYGERNTDWDMNWQQYNIQLNDKEYPTVITKDSVLIKFDVEYQIYFGYDTIIYRIPPKKYSVSNLLKEFPRVDSVAIQNDTLFGFIKRPWVLKETVPTSEMTEQEIDSLIDLNKRVNEVYEKISVNKFNWINVDRFYPEIKERSKVSFELAQNFDFAVAYILFGEQNTVLTLNFNQKGKLIVDFPTNENYKLITYGIVGDKVFAAKKPFTVNGDSIMRVEMKEIDLGQIEKLFNSN